MNHFRAYLAVIPLSVVLLLAAANPALAVTSADIAKHNQAAASARAKAAQQQALATQLKAQTAKLDAMVESLQSQASALDPKIAAADKRTAALRKQVDKLRSQISSQTAQINVTEAERKVQQGLLSERVTATYKQGQWYYFDLLLGSQDMRDLIARTELLTRLLQSNSEVARQLRSTQLTLEQQKNALDHSLTDISAKRQEAVAVATALKQLQDERQGKVDAEQTVLNEKSSLLTESKSNVKRLLAIANAEAAESSRIAAELARAKHGSGTYHGVMAWPVPGFYRVTSPFGMRMHPVLHVKRMHTGIDIGKNGSQPIAGAAIVAAGSGTVISAGSRSGYGNTVMIDHGNGVVTLYAHQPSGGIRVSVGQHVKKGQRIGTVGMSGYATGPHLHFEVRVNGNPVNPTGYL
jgi:murein DD-endopeptidase MepM/ murein hydrolase activator NlpD